MNGHSETHNGREFWYEGDLGGHVLGGRDVAGFVPALWRWLLENFDCRSVLDLGCGEGHDLASFIALGATGMGLEGCQRAIDETAARGRVIKHDFRSGPCVGILADLCYSCEFLEHISPKHLPNVMATIQATGCRVVAVTAALPGTPGHSHINCRDSEYWIAQFGFAGYTYDEESTRIAKVIAAGYRRSGVEPYWISSGLIFQADHVE